jgi:uncharacterized membrane protein YoaK (UPF0700 family)
MQHRSTYPSERETRVAQKQIWAAFLLAWVAGFSDAIGFLLLQQLGASFMSGNSMTTGAALGQMDGSSVLLHGVPILSFVLGIMLGSLVLALVRHWGFRAPFAAVFGLEALCLLAFLVLGSHSLQRGVIRSSPAEIFYLCIILLTLAMGLQTATVQKASGQGVHTTFVTGVLTAWTAALMQYLSWLYRHITEHHVHRALRESRQQPSFRRLLLQGGLWGWYVAGAICGSALELRLALVALIFPVGVLAALIIIDVLRPFEG